MPIARIASGFGVRARLLSAFGLMVILTVSVGSVGWWGISNIQRALNLLQQQSLPEIAQSMSLAEQSASLVAQAPSVANAKILFHLDQEGDKLKEQLATFSLLVQELGAKGLDGKTNPLTGAAIPSEFGLSELAERIEAALLDLIAVTRKSIFLTAKMRDRQFTLATAYETLEDEIVAQPEEVSEFASRRRFWNDVLGEIHRIAGSLTAAMTAEDTASLRTLESRYQKGETLLRSKLAGLSATGPAKSIAQSAAVLLALGAGGNSIFELRREQFRNENRRAYLLTASNILSAELNTQVADIVEGVKQATDRHSVDAAVVLADSQSRIVFLGAVCLVAAIVSMLYVVRNLGGNLSAVTHSMMRLVDGDRDIDVPAINRRDEIGSLARAFNVFRENMLKLDQTSQQLAANNKLLEAVFNNMNDGLSVVDGGGRLVVWNPKFFTLYGLSQANVSAGTPIGVVDHLLSKDKVKVLSLDGRPVSRERVGREPLQVEEYLPDGRVLELRTNRMPDGGFVTIYTDLTERKAIEAQLRQAQKMESVGQLTGGLAHDFNNLLAAVIGNLSLLQEKLAGQQALREKALRALEAADRGAMITQRLLAFSRKQALQAQQVDVNDLIDGMLDLLSYSVGETIHIEPQLQASVWPIVIDPGQLEQALMNLVLNARDAMPEGGSLLIRTANHSVDEHLARQWDIAAGGHVVLSVKDTGTGMSAEVLQRVFEPFFTTKAIGAGSGLGLSMVYGFIKQSGGHVGIDSALGQGTTIKLYLPRAEANTEVALPHVKRAESAALDLRDHTVMVVEDDAGVRQMAVDMLASLGYRTVEAGDGAEALDLLDKAGPISLLFSDVVLPGPMSGVELAEQARQKQPGIKVLYCSGYTRDALLEDGYLMENVDLIQKPYRKEALIQKLRGVFERD